MTQPYALRLAETLEVRNYEPEGTPECQAAAELRRLHAVNEELLEALKLADAMLRGANMDSAIVQKKVEAAIGKTEGKT